MRQTTFTVSCAVLLFLGAAAQQTIRVSVDRHVLPRRSNSKFDVQFVGKEDDYVFTFGGNKSHLKQDDMNSHIDVDLINVSEISYTGPVILGSNQDSGYIVYDTGSGDLTITTPQCDTCTSNIYDPEASASAYDEERPATLNYGSASLDGEYYEDTACVALDACVPDYEIFAITHQEGLDGFDGILGLSPQSDMVFGLKDQGLIDTAVIGYYIATSDKQSQIIFGGFDSELLAEDPIYFPLLHPTYGKTWWWIELTDFSYRGTSVHTPGSSAIIDSGTSLVAAPYSDLIRLGNLVSADSESVTCQAGLCYALGSCDKIADSLGEINFSFGDSDSFTLSPKEYLIDGADLGVPHVCYLGFQGTVSSGKYIVGDTFLRSHYAIYDFENYQVGLARSVGDHSTFVQ